MYAFRFILGAVLAGLGALVLAYDTSGNSVLVGGGFFLAGFIMAPRRKKIVSVVASPVIFLPRVERAKSSLLASVVFVGAVVYVVYKIFGGAL